MKRYQSTSREFRDYLRLNGIPLRYELDDPQDYQRSLTNHISYYQRIYGGLLPQDMSAHILEIGCSEGLFLGFLQQSGYTNYSGIDLAPEKLDIAAIYHPGRVTSADAFEHLPRYPDSYDMVFANFSLEHIPKESTMDFLKVVRGSLKPGGAFIASVPNMDCPFALFARYMDFTHQVGFTVESLVWVFFEAGFQGIQVHDATPISSRFRARLRYKMARAILEYLCGSIGVRNLKRHISESIFCIGYK